MTRSSTTRAIRAEIDRRGGVVETIAHNRHVQDRLAGPDRATSHHCNSRVALGLEGCQERSGDGSKAGEGRLVKHVAASRSRGETAFLKLFKHGRAGMRFGLTHDPADATHFPTPQQAALYGARMSAIIMREFRAEPVAAFVEAGR